MTVWRHGGRRLDDSPPVGWRAAFCPVLQKLALTSDGHTVERILWALMERSAAWSEAAALWERSGTVLSVLWLFL